MKNIQTNITKNKIGILGGMGPQASLELLRLIIHQATHKLGVVSADEFPEIILDSIPISDFISDIRKLDIARKTIVNRAIILKRLGCNPIVLACNTAHIMESDIKDKIGNTFVSLIDMVGNEVQKRQMHKVCVLASPTTIKHNLYGEVLEPRGIEVIHPNSQVQTVHEKIIRKVISGRNSEFDKGVIMKLAQKLLNSNQVDGVILGCTELPVAVGMIDNPQIISSLEILADNLLAAYYNAERSML
jgi:aspartate racemase